MIVPVKADSFSTAIPHGNAHFHALKGVLKAKAQIRLLATKAALRHHFASNEEALDVIMQAIEKPGFTKPGDDIMLALDVAASEMVNASGKEGVYKLYNLRSTRKSAMIWSRGTKTQQKYPIISIEDGMAEEDWKGWGKVDEPNGFISAACRR